MDHLGCYVCLIYTAAGIGVETDAVTIYNGMALCRNHLDTYQRPDWLVDEVNTKVNAWVKRRRRT